MNDKWEQYAAQPAEDKWAQYEAQPIENKSFKKEKENPIKKNNEGYFRRNFINPLKATKGKNDLETAGNLADLLINKPIEMTGLPSLAKGFLGTGIDMGRGVANLIPGVNIPKQQYKELNVNPYVGEGMETIGSLGMGLPVYRGYQAAKKGIEALPYVKKIPELIRNVLAGSGVGAAISPDHRGYGAALGGGAETVPFAIRGAKNWYQGRNTPAREKDLYKAMME